MLLECRLYFMQYPCHFKDKLACCRPDLYIKLLFRPGSEKFQLLQYRLIFHPLILIAMQEERNILPILYYLLRN